MQLIILATCISDFFIGTHHPVLAVPVEKLTTLKQFQTSLIQEYQSDDSFPVQDDQFGELVTKLVNEMEQDPFDHLDDVNPDLSHPIYAYVALQET